MPKPNNAKQTPRKRPQPGVFRPGEQHPEEYRRDLNPDAMAGQNVGIRGPGPNSDIERSRSAYDLKDAHRRLQDMDDDILKGIPILPPGIRLEQGATYLDLSEPNPSEFTGGENVVAGPESWIVPKAKCDYNIWNRLIGVENPERLGLAENAFWGGRLYTRLHRVGRTLMDKILDLIEELWRTLRGERREPVLVPVPVPVRRTIRR